MRKKRVEIYLLFEVMKPIDILRRFPEYSQSTIYKYYGEWKEAKDKVKIMLKGGLK